MSGSTGGSGVRVHTCRSHQIVKKSMTAPMNHATGLRAPSGPDISQSKNRMGGADQASRPRQEKLSDVARVRV
jgi:hypothetical protein